MNGEDSQIYDYGDPNDLARRGSKRRRLLSHRLAEDASKAELEWSSTAQQHTPDFFDAVSSPPSRMTDSHGLPASVQSPWDSQEAFRSHIADFPAYNNGSSYNSRPYFYGQSASQAYASSPPSTGTTTSSWPPAFVEAQAGVYDANIAYTGLLPVQQRAQQQQHPSSFQDGIQYYEPHDASKMLYEASVVQGYGPGLALENDNTLSETTYVPQTPASVHFAGPSQDRAGSRNLLVLDHLATQIIQTVVRLNHVEFQDLLHGTSSAGRQYLNTTALFEQARRTIAPASAGFIDASIAQTYSPPQQDVLRKANTAIFIVSVLGAATVPFVHLDQAFLEIFVPLGHRLLKWQGAIYLELKTQTCILAVMNSSGLPETLLDELFPLDLQSQVLQRHPEAPSLSPSEQDFIDRCKARRQYLLAESYSLDARSELPNKYPWSDFIREFSSSISKNIDHILHSSHRQPAMHGLMNRRRAGSGPVSYERGSVDSHHDVRRSISSGGHVHRVEKKATANGQTIRQAWVKAEEEALIAGLERVGGPHWSQILALYGRGGSISEVLKDRNQVQLKDKARNLKLWYLKMGQEVPVALRGVTGELRKRGGARARAALEAEEQGAAKERRSSDETEQQDIESMLGVRHDTVEPSAYDRRQKK